MTGLLTIRRNLVRRNGKTILKDTKTHQMRVIKLDQDTVTILTAHKGIRSVRSAAAPNSAPHSTTTPSYSPTPPTTGGIAIQTASPTSTPK